MKKVLVANRGEIARRVLRTLKKMNIQSVAIYSDADANAPHVLEADEAVYVGKSPSAESYLQQDLILKICKDLGVDGIHPGYGFLSENSGFARKVKDAGMKLIGPSPESMELMGDKLSAKQAVKSTTCRWFLELMKRFPIFQRQNASLLKLDIQSSSKLPLVEVERECALCTKKVNSKNK